MNHISHNWLTISHHYHHETIIGFLNIQILLEMHFILIFPLLNEYLFDNVLDKWVMIFLYLVYTTTHNINYSIFRKPTHESITKIYLPIWVQIFVIYYLKQRTKKIKR